MCFFIFLVMTLNIDPVQDDTSLDICLLHVLHSQASNLPLVGMLNSATVGPCGLIRWIGLLPFQLFLFLYVAHLYLRILQYGAKD